MVIYWLFLLGLVVIQLNLNSGNKVARHRILLNHIVSNPFHQVLNTNNHASRWIRAIDHLDDLQYRRHINNLALDYPKLINCFLRSVYQMFDLIIWRQVEFQRGKELSFLEECYEPVLLCLCVFWVDDLSDFSIQLGVWSLDRFNKVAWCHFSNLLNQIWQSIF